jgi:hypothetical protein
MVGAWRDHWVQAAGDRRWGGGLDYAAVSVAIKRQQQRATSDTKLIAESAMLRCVSNGALHSEALLIQVKLDKFRALETHALVESLRPGTPGALKTRPDGTMLDGHHRIAVLKMRGFAVDTLPREVIEKRDGGSDTL